MSTIHRICAAVGMPKPRKNLEILGCGLLLASLGLINRLHPVLQDYTGEGTSFYYATKNIHSNNEKNSSSVFDTCNLTVADPLHPDVLPHHHPHYNPLEGCKPADPLVKLMNGKVILTDASSGFNCKAREAFFANTESSSAYYGHLNTARALESEYALGWRRFLSVDDAFEVSDRCLLHLDESRYSVEKWVVLPSEAKFACDVVETDCEDENGSHENLIHSQIYEHDDDKEKIRRNRPRSTAVVRPDVYIILLDSVSSSMAKRSLPKSVAFLKDKMKGVQMEFLNKVGANSKGNGFPLSFGKSIIGSNGDLYGTSFKPDWNQEVICPHYLNKSGYYLHQFANAGYKTMVAQDDGDGILYITNCLGLKTRQADHMWRPFSLRFDESPSIRRSHAHSCSELHVEMIDYLEKFINSYQETPKIAQLWVTTLAHSTMKDLYHADEQFLLFFHRNHHRLDNAFVFFMSDHGPRFEGVLESHLGYYESKNPLLLVTMPERYRLSDIYKQLRGKSHLLMTPFDVHATLMDILEFQPRSDFKDSSSRSMQPHSKGSSLLRPWTGARNCRTLPIPPNWCLCKYEYTNVTDRALIEKMGAMIASAINGILLKGGVMRFCRAQAFDKIWSAYALQDGHDTVYLVSVIVRPSGKLYSVSVNAYFRSTAGRLKLATKPDGRNVYGPMSECVSTWRPNADLRQYCQCRRKVFYTPIPRRWHGLVHINIGVDLLLLFYLSVIGVLCLTIYLKKNGKCILQWFSSCKSRHRNPYKILPVTHNGRSTLSHEKCCVEESN